MITSASSGKQAVKHSLEVKRMWEDIEPNESLMKLTVCVTALWRMERQMTSNT